MALEGTIDVAAKYQQLTIPLAANTAPTLTTFNLGERMLVELDVLFSPGHAGLTGIHVNYNGTAILPWNQPGVFLVGDNERRTFTIGLHVSAPLQVFAQNLDKGYPHTIYVTAKLTELDLSAGAAVTPIPLLGLVGA